MLPYTLSSLSLSHLIPPLFTLFTVSVAIIPHRLPSLYSPSLSQYCHLISSLSLFPSSLIPSLFTLIRICYHHPSSPPYPLISILVSVLSPLLFLIFNSILFHPFPIFSHSHLYYPHLSLPLSLHPRLCTVTSSVSSLILISIPIFPHPLASRSYQSASSSSPHLPSPPRR